MFVFYIASYFMVYMAVALYFYMLLLYNRHVNIRACVCTCTIIVNGAHVSVKPLSPFSHALLIMFDLIIMY